MKPLQKLVFSSLVVLFCAPAFVSAWAQQSNDVPHDPPVQISAHAWVIKGDTNIGIVVGDRATLVVETGLGTPNGKIIADAAKRLSTKGQKLYLTTTHYHAEHATGDDGFPPDAILIRPRIQQAELVADGQTVIDIFTKRSAHDKATLHGFRYKTPGILFDNEYRLDLGGVSVRLLSFGAAHTKGDELIMVDPDSVLYSGDVVQNKAGPGFCTDCNPRRWLSVLDHVAALAPKIIVPDHSALGDNSLIAQERGMIADIQSSIRAQKAEGKSADEASQVIAKQFAVKYQGWTRMNGIAGQIKQLYAGADAP